MKMAPTFNAKKVLRFGLILCATTAIIVGVILLTTFVSTNDAASQMVQKFGYLGVLSIAIVAGLNAIVPVPAATFVPIFAEVGLWMPLIIVMLVIGTTIADMIGYLIGRLGKEFVADHYPWMYEKVLRLDNTHRDKIPLFVMFFAAFAPLPNEAMLIPLAMVGVELRKFIVPLILGTTANQILLAYGFHKAFLTFFGG